MPMDSVSKRKIWKYFAFTIMIKGIAAILLTSCLPITSSRPQGTSIGNAGVSFELAEAPESDTSLALCVSRLTIFRTNKNGNGSKPYQFDFQDSLIELSPTGNFIHKVELSPGRYNKIVLKLKNQCNGSETTTIVNAHGTFHAKGAIHLVWNGDVDVSDVSSVITLQVEKLLEAASLVDSDQGIKEILESSSNNVEIAADPTPPEEVKVEIVLDPDKDRGEDIPKIKGCISGILLSLGDDQKSIEFPAGEKDFSKTKGIGKLDIPVGTYDHGAFLLDSCSTKHGDFSIKLEINKKSNFLESRLDKNIKVSISEPTEMHFSGNIVVDKNVNKLNFLMKSLLESAKTVRTESDLEDLLSGSSGQLSVK